LTRAKISRSRCVGLLVACVHPAAKKRAVRVGMIYYIAHDDFTFVCFGVLYYQPTGRMFRGIGFVPPICFVGKCAVKKGAFSTVLQCLISLGA
jgi:hypothetical protein